MSEIWSERRRHELIGAVIMEFRGLTYIDAEAEAFRRYIEDHEEAPVDPLRKEAIELVISEEVYRTDNQVAAIRNGLAGLAKIALVERALRRGMELAKERQP